MYQNTPVGKGGVEAKAKEQLKRGEYNKKEHKKAQAEVEAAKRKPGALITIKGPYLKTTVKEQRTKQNRAVL